MVNPKLEKPRLLYNALSTVDCKTTKPFLLIVITPSQAKRLSQVSGNKFDRVAEQIILVKPKDFKEQTAVIDHIQDYTAKNFGLIIIDTFTSLYGAKVAEATGKTFSINRELNRQLAILAQTTRIRKIPVIITSQVRAVFDNENSGSVAPVATRVLKFWADTIISMKPTTVPSKY